jgi:hypothetical protein
VSDRVPTAVWPVSATLVLALDDRFGLPVDSYLNGTQTWLTDDGPGGATLEWRLHPVGGFAPPPLSHHDLWETVVGALRDSADPDALALGDEPRPLTSLWEGLECFPAFGDDLEPAVLAASATEALGVAPDRAGLVDHAAIGERWERSKRAESITAMLLDELGRRP